MQDFIYDCFSAMIETSQDPNLPTYITICWVITFALGLNLVYLTLGKALQHQIKAQSPKPKTTRVSQEMQLS
ncbi:MAG: hypothetical protein SFT94_04840 [Pseudanabaenaceae cyanobacterium bins.68]|nr:hypothetical protein [Pseudanabaenaceae cyanobacterium bins.68]